MHSFLSWPSATSDADVLFSGSSPLSRHLIDGECDHTFGLPAVGHGWPVFDAICLCGAVRTLAHGDCALLSERLPHIRLKDASLYAATFLAVFGSVMTLFSV